jgi:hypothetical protein
MIDFDNKPVASYLSYCDEMTQAEGIFYEGLDKKNIQLTLTLINAKKKGRDGIEFILELGNFSFFLFFNAKKKKMARNVMAGK